ncbi:MAG: twin-arginine translocation signal domain-containing protein, partial [Rhizobiales bacterium]|nr:twin-arginine translocation signal domain-containing protein [Hyphomicrobiales bacterium]
MSFKPTLTRRDFLKSTSTVIGSLCTLSAASQVSPLIAKPAELTPSLMAKAISVHIPLWHQGQLDSHKFWNEVFQDLSA